MKEELLVDRNFLEAAYGDLVMPMCVVDPQGTTVYTNRADEGMLGRTKDDLVGKSVSDYFVHKEDFSKLQQCWNDKRRVEDYTTSIRHADGTVIRVRLSSCPLPLNPSYTCVFKRNVEVFQRRSENLEILNYAIKELALARDTGTALDKVLKIVVPALASWMTIDVFRNGEVTMLKVEHADNPKLEKAVDYKRSTNSATDRSSFLYQTLKEGRVWYFPFVNEKILREQIQEEERRNFLLQFNISSTIIVPMYYNEQIYGAMTFIRTDQGMHYNEDDLVLFQNLANHIALVLENVRLNEEAQNEIRLRERAEQYFRLISESVPQKILTTDRTGKATYYNSQWEDFLGVTIDEIYQSGLWSYVHADEVDLTRKKWQEALASGEDFQFEHRFVDREGTYRWQLTRARPVWDEHGHLESWIASVTDIDEQKKAEEKKDEFITVASHELKTPLTSVKAYLQLLEKMINPQEKSYLFLQKSTAQIRRLEFLVRDLLDVGRISAGKISYNMCDFNMGDLLKEVVENCRDMYPDFQILLEEGADFVFYGDRVRIEQILVNLLNNAVKYSGDRKEVVVSSGLEDRWYVIKVQDYGIGISQEHIRELFQRFFRVNTTYQGVGLGLYIAREIAETHQGRIDVESKLGKGTTFYLKFPRKKKEET